MAKVKSSKWDAGNYRKHAREGGGGTNIDNFHQIFGGILAGRLFIHHTHHNRFTVLAARAPAAALLGNARASHRQAAARTRRLNLRFRLRSACLRSSSRPVPLPVPTIRRFTMRTQAFTFVALPALLAGMAGLLGLASVASAVITTFQPVRDNTLFEDPAGSLSNGAGSYLFAGKTNVLTLRRSLLSFDVTSIPADATINSVSLRLYVSRSAGATEVCTLHTVLAHWGEGTSNSDLSMGGGLGAAAASNDATWLDRFFGASRPWTNAGGDFDAEAVATAAIGGVGFYSFSSPDMISQVSSWRNLSNLNAGWIILGNESDSGTAKRFESRESQLINNRPLLTVDYTPIPSTGGAAALALAALSALGRRTRRP